MVSSIYTDSIVTSSASILPITSISTISSGPSLSNSTWTATVSSTGTNVSSANVGPITSILFPSLPIVTLYIPINVIPSAQTQTSLSISLVGSYPAMKLISACFDQFISGSSNTVYSKSVTTPGSANQLQVNFGANLGGVSHVGIVRAIYTLSYLAAQLTSLPVLSSGTFLSSQLNSTATASQDFTFANVDRVHTWFQISGFDTNNQYGNSAFYTTLAAAQASTTGFPQPSGALVGYSEADGYYSCYLQATSPPFYLNTNNLRSVYSGWIVPGGVCQLVGFVTYSTAAPTANNCWFSPYGYKSQSPLATVNNATTYILTTSNTKTEILSQCPLVGLLAFIYDASLGNFGQVTWLSQI
ncbi:MAG: hypothetical protein EOP45_05360 [Sphingobacteriaceae bacterium]|nr:MAG: hypothetical protein EOP45_05360 [Sphingobacteriaceae bacterium]